MVRNALLRNQQENIASKPPQWGNFPPMVLVCMICTEMSGSGVRMTSGKIIKAHLGMVVLGEKRAKNSKIRQKKLCGAVLGTSIPISAVPLPAATTSAAATTATAVFGWCAVLGGLCNPFSLFFLFTLFLLFDFFEQMYYI